MRWVSSRTAFAVGAIVAIVLADEPVAAYEFDVRALTYGQLSQRVLIQPTAGNAGLNRRRFTQTLSLNIWDIGGRRKGLGLYDTKQESGPDIYFSSFLRLDHDFGEFTRDQVNFAGQTYDAIDLIPELAGQSLGIELLWAVVGVRNLAGFVDIEVGRQLKINTLDWWSFDGATVKVHTPWRFAVEAFGGVRTRDESLLGSAVLDPDGTADAECAEYLEGASPGTGTWAPLPIGEPGTDSFRADSFQCPQRSEYMPTFGAAVETEGLPVTARLAYRRSVSRSPGIIGDPFRFANEDLGYYPNDFGEAPGWGVNEERISLSTSSSFRLRNGRAHVAPFAAVRYSILHNWFDEGQLGARMRWGAHRLTPEYYYSFPTFDGDSIFNAFSVSGYHDLRLTYELAPAKADWSSYARTWVRVFNSGDALDDPDSPGYAPGGGLALGGRLRFGRQLNLRADGFYEDGFGGRRAGGYTSGRWQVLKRLAFSSRVSVVRYEEDRLTTLRGTSVGVQLGSTYVFAPGISLHVTGEETVRASGVNGFQDKQRFQLFAVLDLAFAPEL